MPAPMTTIWDRDIAVLLQSQVLAYGPLCPLRLRLLVRRRALPCRSSEVYETWSFCLRVSGAVAPSASGNPDLSHDVVELCKKTVGRYFASKAHEIILRCRNRGVNQRRLGVTRDRVPPRCCRSAPRW